MPKPIITSDQALNLDFIPEKVVVLGGVTDPLKAATRQWANLGAFVAPASQGTHS